MNVTTVLNAFAGRRALLVVAAVVAVVTVIVVTRYGSGGNAGDVSQVRTGVSAAAAVSSAPAKTSPADDDSDGDDDDGDDDDGDDGVADTPAASVTITDGPADPGQAGTQFLTTWLTTAGKTPAQWRDSLHPLVTPQLWDLLADADPATVPDGKLVGSAQVKPAGDLMVTVTVQINRGAHAEVANGAVTVTMTARTHRWLAAQVDWTVTR